MHFILTDALNVLEAEWHLLQNAGDGEELGLQLLDFLQVLHSHTALSVLLKEIQGDEIASVEKMSSTEERARTAVVKLLSSALAEKSEMAIEDVARALENSTAEDVNELTPDLQILARSRWKPEILDPGRAANKESNAALMVELLVSFLKTTNASQALRDAAQQLQLDLEYCRRARRLESKQRGGAALARLERIGSVLLPKPKPSPDGMERVRWYSDRRREGIGGLHNLVYGGDERDIGLGNVFIEIRRNAKSLYTDMRRRLSGRLSLIIPLLRFKERAESYDAERLRGVYQDNTRSGEDRLTAQLALYLYDLGLKPLLKPMIGRLQPDLVSLDSCRLYVESKIYTGKKYILRATYQMWDTIGRMRGIGYPIREAFLVVFRLRGPRLMLPSSVAADGVTMFPIVVDIAPNSVSGHNQRFPPVQITEEEMFPEPDSHNRNGRQNSWWPSDRESRSRKPAKRRKEPKHIK